MRRAIVTILVAVFVLVGAAPASAHVLLEQAIPQGDGTVELVFTFDHSCDAAPTTGMTVTMPDGSTVLEASGPDGWQVEASDAEVAFTGPGIERGEGEAFTVLAELSGSVGDTLLFPTEQTCDDGDGYAWVDASESEERPSPRLIATAATVATAVAPVLAGDGGATTLQVVLAIAAFTVLVGGVAHRLRP